MEANSNLSINKARWETFQMETFQMVVQRETPEYVEISIISIRDTIYCLYLKALEQSFSAETA